MTSLNNDKKIHVIVHGIRQNYDKVKSMLVERKLNEEKITMASLEKAGDIGEYVAMTWPPMASLHILQSLLLFLKMPWLFSLHLIFFLPT